MLENYKIKEFKLSLINTKLKLEKLSIATQPSREPVQLDQTSVGRLSRVDSMQRQAMNIETERRRVAKINLIKSALTRIKDKKYGLCLSCGESIEKARLQHNPEIPNCLQCALEKA